MKHCFNQSEHLTFRAYAKKLKDLFMNKLSRRAWLRTVLILACASLLAVPAFAQAQKKILVVSVTKGFRHDVIPTADKMLGELAAKSGKFAVDYVRDDKDMAAKMTADALKNYDGVVFNNTTGDLPLPDRDAFLAWIKSGKGFIGLHAATDTFPGFPAYTEMIGAHFLGHGAQVEVKVYNQDPFHPATRHLGPSFYVFDEIYNVKDFHRDTVHGLLTQDKQPNTGVPGDYPIAWCKMYGQGRVFYTSLGHRVDVVEKPYYQEHVLNGILWSLGLLPGDATPQSTAYKVTEDEAQLGFKPLFSGVDLSGWKLREANGLASWSAQNGMLVNVIPEKQHGTDLVTEAKYKDFIVRYEYMIPKGANSGFYLRGRHEIQILDDYPNCTPSVSSDGSIYNFKAPDKFASKKPGEWNCVEATMKGNRVTVVLNGVTIHDNVVVDRATGSELDNKVNEPGSIFVQGNHGMVGFRKMRIKSLD